MLAPKKSLGQNFLQDDNVARNIVERLHLQQDDVVVEIGPGKGALTQHLTSHANAIIAIELDERAVGVLKELFGPTIEIIHADVREVNLTGLSQQRGKRFRIIGNIPYYITSEILFWLFEHYAAVVDATMMVQLEVARRFVAKPRTKDYGILSILTQFYSKPELLFKVSRNSFYPKPSVDSAVVKFEFHRKLPECNQKLFKNIVRSTFGKRRKTLRNGLKYMGLEERALAAIPFDLNRRPETLSLEEFIRLTELVEPFQNVLTLKF
ncbi:MAG: ribosomal RNA small subunit methyltransferase A [Ignavibacteriales bacterium]|nr:ribosomal RNA small subunit methyltransferase A [Ignavibacteriales bacterium]